jgi:hypothetical protein
MDCKVDVIKAFPDTPNLYQITVSIAAPTLRTRLAAKVSPEFDSTTACSDATTDVATLSHSLLLYPQLSFSNTTSFTPPARSRGAPNVRYPRLSRNVMSLLPPTTLPAGSFWTNTFLINSSSTTGLIGLTVTNGSTVACARNVSLSGLPTQP